MTTPKPTLIDLYCGRGGWSKAALRAGWRAIGYDAIPQPNYPGELIVMKLPCELPELRRHNPTLICASPPCEQFARHHLPWIKDPATPDETQLRWAISLIEHFPKTVVECSRFASWHVEGARYIRPYALWGHVPALMPTDFGTKDARRGSSKTPYDERKARAAEIPRELADWIIHTACPSWTR